jgi:hypothetical protein
MTTVICNKCGKVKRSLDAETEAIYIKNFGSKEKMIKGFLCMKCKPKKEKAKKEKKAKKE